MRTHLAALLMSSTTCGCSLLYNPDNLAVRIADAAEPPGMADADPSMLVVDDVGPRVLLEGQGTGGSRPAILTLTGHHFVDGVQVQLIAPGGEAVMFVVDNLNIVVAPGRDVLAVPVWLPVDVGRGADMVPMTIQVTQGAVTKVLENKLQIRNLNELGNIAVTDSATLASLYSQIDHPAPITFAVTPDKPPAVFRAVSSIVLGDVKANAALAVPGPGGSSGGAASTAGAGMGGGQPGSGTGGAGGAGFVTAGGAGLVDPGGTGGAGGPPIGEPLIREFATNHGSGGGGGVGSPGGAGGGTVEITAGGTVKVGRIEVNGGDAGVAGTSGGGGGAGGVVVIRAGLFAELTGPIEAKPGTASAGTGGRGGGAGRNGRIRIDAPVVFGTSPITPPAHRGMSLDPTSPRSTRNVMQPIVSYGRLGDAFKVFVLNAAGNSTSQSTAVFGTTTININPTLSAGYNRVCVTSNNNVTVAEATNCIDMAYLP